MSTASTAAAIEAYKAQQTTQVALAIIAARIFLQSGKLWAESLATSSSTQAGAAKWVTQTLRILRVARKQSTEVALSGANLRRALHTNEVLRLPGVPQSERIPLNTVRKQFHKAVMDYAPTAFNEAKAIVDSAHEGAEGVVPVLEIGGMKLPELSYEPWQPGSRDASLKGAYLKGVEKVLADSEKEWEREARKTLVEAAEENLRQIQREKKRLQKALEGLDKAEKLETKQLDVASRKAGTAAAHNVQSAARDATFRVHMADRRVRAWARVNFPKPGGSPCAFCAMLLSRGAIYASADKAGGDIGSPSQFHPNCRCQAIPLYAGEGEWRDLPEFRQNVFYESLYKKKYPKFGSRKKQFNTWRRMIDSANRGYVKPGVSDPVKEKVSEA